MKNYLILMSVVIIIAILLSKVIYALTWERWMLILLSVSLFLSFRNKSIFGRKK